MVLINIFIIEEHRRTCSAATYKPRFSKNFCNTYCFTGPLPAQGDTLRQNVETIAESPLANSLL
jgi:hypothetical protein